ncbi:MAG: hypothetical protein U0168_21400 [Nannocystaceae bacterium]
MRKLAVHDRGRLGTRLRRRRADADASASATIGSVSIGSISASATDGGSGTAGNGRQQDGTADATWRDHAVCERRRVPAGPALRAGLGACSPPDACMLPGDCEGGFMCEDGQCTIGGCGGFQFALDNVPPNVLILLDRSGSMDGDVPGTSDNRWEVAVSVVDSVTTTFDSTVRFGLATYSSCIPPGCPGRHDRGADLAEQRRQHPDVPRHHRGRRQPRRPGRRW